MGRKSEQPRSFRVPLLSSSLRDGAHLSPRFEQAKESFFLLFLLFPVRLFLDPTLPPLRCSSLSPAISLTPLIVEGCRSG
jgi:hypothetical protein